MKSNNDNTNNDNNNTNNDLESKEEMLPAELAKWFAENRNTPPEHIIIDQAFTQSLEEFYAADNDKGRSFKFKPVTPEEFEEKSTSRLQRIKGYLSNTPVGIGTEDFSSSTTRNLLHAFATRAASAINYVQSFYEDDRNDHTFDNCYEMEEVEVYDPSESNIHSGYQLDSTIEENKRIIAEENSDTPSLSVEYGTDPEDINNGIERSVSFGYGVIYYDNNNGMELSEPSLDDPRRNSIDLDDASNSNTMRMKS